MQLIFWGFVFTLLNFNITAGNSVISLLPDFVGYILILKGISQISTFSDHFKTIRPWAFGMAIFTGILFVIDVLGMQFNFIYYLLIIAAVACSLYIQYHIILGVQDIEKSQNVFLNSIILLMLFKIVAICSSIAVLSLYIFPAIYIILIVVAAISSIFFLFHFYKTTKLFNSVPPPIDYSVE